MRPPGWIVVTSALVAVLLLYAADSWWSTAAARRAKTVPTTGLPTKPDPGRPTKADPGLPNKPGPGLPDPTRDCSWGPAVWCGRLPSVVCQETKNCTDLPETVKPTPNAWLQSWAKVALQMRRAAEEARNKPLDPKIVVLLIECNNLATNTNSEIAQGAVSYLRGAFKQLSTHIVVMALLPLARCLRDEAGRLTTCLHLGNRSQEANSALETNLHGISEATFLDCTSSVLEEGAPDPPSHLLGDGVHPTHLGYRHIWAMCLLPELKKH
eukprot:gene3409-5334_t